jgi:hypothetical protein
MPYLYVKWNSFRCGSLADGSVIRAWVCLRRPLPGTEACDAAGGAFRPQWREWPAPES